MVWTYHQSSGKLERDGRLIGHGYSGAGDKGKNKAKMEAVPYVGPIPRGRYSIGKPRMSAKRGPHVMDLTPIGHNALGRTEFLIHGDSKAHPGEASEGCVILSRDLRVQISTSGDAELEVVEGIELAKTAKVLEEGSDALSGAAWWKKNQKKYPGSAKISDLAAGFRENVTTFVKALQKAGATVRVAQTFRHETRAQLMYYSYNLANGKLAAAKIPAIPGCEIKWDHGDEKASQKAAQEMVDLFGIVFPPALGSLHRSGRAIDMWIKWSGVIKVLDATGRYVEVGSPFAGEKNPTLHKIGKTYGVHKLVTDRPHWSDNGK